MRFFGRRGSNDTAVAPTPTHVEPELSKEQVKRATRTRKTWALLTSFFLFVTVIFLILVHIGGVRNRSVINNWYFLRLDVSDIVASSVPGSQLINTIAQSLGLHDYYQTGLWGYCEGFENEGVTFCSDPQTLFWFNPIEILQEELLAGASINLPSSLNDDLELVRVASRWMFGLFLTGTCLSFVLIFLMPVSVYTRWLALPVAIFAFLNALIVTAASIVATVLFIIYRNTLTSVEELNIDAELGTTLYAFMWVASAFAILAWLVQMGLCCCCASRRSVKKNNKRNSEKAYPTDTSQPITPAADAPITAAEPPQKKKFWQRR
ncbi:hypothetical protein ACN47E_003587 [Coniothyrium glycines]